MRFSFFKRLMGGSGSRGREVKEKGDDVKQDEIKENKEIENL